jgi:quercetin dioxygenase-like cupin family protein
MRAAAFGVFGFVLGAIAGSIASVIAAQRAIESTQLIKKDVVGCPGKQVSVSIASAGVGTSGDHFHPGESFTYVLAGTETREAAGEPTRTIGPGGFIYDAPGQIHRTSNSTPVKLLTFRLLDKGKPETIRSVQ